MADHPREIPEHLASFLLQSSSTVANQSSSNVAQAGSDMPSTEDHLPSTTPSTDFDAAGNLQGLADAIVNDMEEYILKPLGPFAGVAPPPSRGRNAAANEPKMEWMKHLAMSSESISHRLLEGRRAALRLRPQASIASTQGEGSRRPVCRICHNGSHRSDKCWFFQIPGIVPGSVLMPNLTPEIWSKNRAHPALCQESVMVLAPVPSKRDKKSKKSKN